jgi:hypothetical protein
MPCPPPRCSIFLCLLAPSIATAQNFLPLDFSRNVQPTNGIYPNNSTLGPHYNSNTTFDFTNVTTRDGQAIDARVTILGTSGNYEFVGWIPDYNNAGGQPEGDLGVYYRHNRIFDQFDGSMSPGGYSTGGISYSISFFVGGGLFTDAAVLSDVGFLIYDHDGEPGQSESIRTYESDGFTGYRIHDGSGIHTHDEDGTWRFDAAGGNLSETGPQGGFIAYYQNTSSIRFDLFATTSSDNPSGNNGVFTAFDGDLSLTAGGTDNFGAFVPVPEPSACCLLASALLLALTRRKRPAM